MPKRQKDETKTTVNYKLFFQDLKDPRGPLEKTICSNQSQVVENQVDLPTHQEKAKHSEGRDDQPPPTAGGEKMKNPQVGTLHCHTPLTPIIPP
jgi:hypothetical protein